MDYEQKQPTHFIVQGADGPSVTAITCLKTCFENESDLSVVPGQNQTSTYSKL